MATRNFIQANKTDVKFDELRTLALTQKYSADKTEIIASGAMARDETLAGEYSGNTGTVERPFWFYDYVKPDQWTGKQDGNIDKVGNKTIRSTLVRHYKAWGFNTLANYMARGVSPEQAINNVITEHKNTALRNTMYSVLKGVFANTTIQGKMIYGDGTKSLKTSDFTKARAMFWKDRATETPVFYIMHSVVYTALVTQLTETTMVNFLQGARIIVDDTITTGSDGVYETYMFRNGAIRWSGDLPLNRAGAFVQTDEERNQGETIIGYRRAFAIEVPNVSFTGTLDDPTGASDTELETGTNWTEVIDDTRLTLVGMLKSKESIDPADVMGMAEITSGKASKG